MARIGTLHADDGGAQISTPPLHPMAEAPPSGRMLCSSRANAVDLILKLRRRRT
jgi:hypothetical protein